MKSIFKAIKIIGYSIIGLAAGLTAATFLYTCAILASIPKPMTLEESSLLVTRVVKRRQRLDNLQEKEKKVGYIVKQQLEEFYSRHQWTSSEKQNEILETISMLSAEDFCQLTGLNYKAFCDKTNVTRKDK